MSAEPSRPRLVLLEGLVPSWRAINLAPSIGSPLGASFWPFNPSIHQSSDDRTWRCIVRLANYSIPNGVTIAPAGATQTTNVMLVLDPRTWEATSLDIVHELDTLYRTPHCASLGYEDVRLFDALDSPFRVIYGIACVLQCNTLRPGSPEQVLLEIDAHTHDIRTAVPLRGEWSHRAQKNWSPFDAKTGRGDLRRTPRFLYDIEDGVTIGTRPGSTRVTGDSPAIGAQYNVPYAAWIEAFAEGGRSVGARARAKDAQIEPTNQKGVEVRRVLRTAVTPRAQEVIQQRRPGSDRLRGGSQLVQLDAGGDGRWLSIGHEMTMTGARKLYWHTFYTCDDAGRVLEKSPPFKLADYAIEFAAGLQLADDDIVVSYGTDDHEAWLGICRLDQVLALLRPVSRSTPADPCDALPTPIPRDALPSPRDALPSLRGGEERSARRVDDRGGEWRSARRTGDR